MSCACLINWLHFENSLQLLTVISCVSPLILRPDEICQYYPHKSKAHCTYKIQDITNFLPGLSQDSSLSATGPGVMKPISLP